MIKHRTINTILFCKMFLPFIVLLLTQKYVTSQTNSVKMKISEDDNHMDHNCNAYNISCQIGPHMLSRSGEFFNMLKITADSKKLILFAVIDSAYLDMAINLHETSINRFRITNFVFICLDNSSFNSLKKRRINSFLYKQKVASDNPARFATKQFNEKTSIKMKIVAASVMLGFNTLLMDVDIVFFRNPIPHLPLEFDLAIQDDMQTWNFTKMGVEILGNNGSIIESLRVLNTGFMLVCPTYAGVELMHRTLREIELTGSMDQTALNIVARRMMDAKSINMKVLDKKLFACGKAYFDEGRQMFGGELDNVGNRYYIVHNNWIFGKAAKIYRFKESRLWQYDGHQYYSNKNNKYLYFSRPVKAGMEVAALITALTLGTILNRIVILPKFRCRGSNFEVCKPKDKDCELCPFNVHFHVETFEEIFKDKYRESEFLKHSKVPNLVKQSTSPEIHLVNSFTKKKKAKSDNQAIINVRNKEDISMKTLISRFGNESSFGNYSILKFKNINFNINDRNDIWRDQLLQSIVQSNWQQHPSTIRKLRLN